MWSTVQPKWPSAPTSQPAELSIQAQSSTPSVQVQLPNQASVQFTGFPDHKYQLGGVTPLLFEHDFEDSVYISARLQRLQHGYYSSSTTTFIPQLDNLTFIALNFTIHPSFSLYHRVKSAVVSLSFVATPPAEPFAESQPIHSVPLRIIKFAPHVAFGRVSTEKLSWQFQLGANVGINSTTGPGSELPVAAGLTPSISRSSEVVLDAMLKIQGSSRSAVWELPRLYSRYLPGTGSGLASSSNVTIRPEEKESRSQNHAQAWPQGPNALIKSKIPDTKLVWTLEENLQQKSGLPREFTFVVLVQRPSPSPQFQINLDVKPVISRDMNASEVFSFLKDKTATSTLVGTKEIGQRLRFASPSGATDNSGVGVNFADIDFEQLVELPGSAFSSQEIMVAQNVAGGARDSTGGTASASDS